MFELHSLSPIILIIFAYLFLMVLTVYLKKDMSIANFAWGGGVALIALYMLPAQRFTILAMFVLLFSLIIQIYTPRYLDNVVGRFAQRHTWLFHALKCFALLFFFSRIFDFQNIIRPLLATTLICFWASRMIAHLYCRYTGKDPRFTTWRQMEGTKALAMHVAYIFGSQLLLMVIMSVPIILINLHSGPGLNLLDYVGLAIWSVGFIFESVSDYQLFAFTHDPSNQGKIMRSGLWRYSRHPNYFGEVLIWVGMMVLALSVPYGWVAIIAPATITILLVGVTGAPWTEKALENNPEFVDYKKHTSFFIPWFVKAN